MAGPGFNPGDPATQRARIRGRKKLIGSRMTGLNPVTCARLLDGRVRVLRTRIETVARKARRSPAMVNL